MKLAIRLRGESEISDHQLDLRAATDPQPRGGQLQFHLDGGLGEANWAEIAAGVYSILVAGRSYEVRVTGCRDKLPLSRHKSSYIVDVATRRYFIEIQDARRRRIVRSAAIPEGSQDILAPMPGKILKVLVSENQNVTQGEGLLVIEAMKMQNELRAPRSGRVEKIYVMEGTGVEMGFKLLRLI